MTAHHLVLKQTSSTPESKHTVTIIRSQEELKETLKHHLQNLSKKDHTKHNTITVSTIMPKPFFLIIPTLSYFPIVIIALQPQDTHQCSKLEETSYNNNHMHL